MSDDGAHRRQFIAVALAIGGLTGLVLAGLAGFVLAQRDAILSAAEDRLRARVAVLAGQTQEVFRSADVALRSAAGAMRADLAGPPHVPRDDRAIYESLRDVSDLLPGVRSLYVVGRDGVLRHSSIAFPNPPFDASKQAFFLAHTADNVESFIDEPVLGRLTGRWFVNFTRRVQDESGRFIGAVGAAMEPDYFARLFHDADAGPETRVALARADGLILAAWPPLDGDGRPFLGRKMDDVAVFRAARALGPPGPQPVSLDDGEVIGAIQALPGHPLILAQVRRRDAVLAQWRGVAIAMLAGGVAALALTAAGLTAIHRQTRRRADAEAAMRRANERFDLAVTCADDGVWDWDLDADLVWASAAFGRLLGLGGWSRGAPAGDLWRLIHADDRPSFDAAVIAQSAPQAPPFATVARMRGASDRWIWVELRGSAARDDSGRPRRLVGTARDVTERRLLEMRLAQAQKMESLGALAGGVAHNFNNMLQAVIMLIGQARRREDPAERDDALVKALSAAEHGARIVREILLFARADRTAETGVVDMTALARRTVELILAAAPPSAQVMVEAPRRPIYVRGSASQLQQVAATLVVNALQSAGGRAAPVRLEVTEVEERAPPPRIAAAGPDQDGSVYYMEAGDDVEPSRLWAGHGVAGPCARLRVVDAGDGVPPQVLDRIFEPFFTTKAMDAGDGLGQGAGLGLSVLLGVVKAHRGLVRVETRVGQGSSFDVLIPILDDPPADRAPFLA